MTDAFSAMNGQEIFFTICAVVGGFFVLVKLVLQFVGADTDMDTDLDIDADSGIDIHHVDSDMGFKLLSLYGLTSFLMMFGLVGLALYRQSHAGFVVSLAGGTAAGFASVWVIGRLFALIGRLQSSGTLDTATATGSTGTVYLTIPAGGTGRVTINFKGRLREFDAMAASGEQLATGTPIRVARVDASLLVVEPIR